MRTLIWRPCVHFVLISLLTGLSVFDAADSKEETGDLVVRKTIPRTDDAPSTAGPGVQEHSVKVVNGLVSVTVRSRPLATVLAEVSQAGRVAIVLGDAEAANQPVTLRFKDLPLDQGLLQLLRGYDVFFSYAADQQRGMVLNAVWVYAKGRGRGLAPIGPELWASTREMEKRVNDPNPEIRAKAIEALASRRGAEALDAIIGALKDDHSDVRTQALYGAVMAGVSLPEEMLSTLALTDPSADVRFLALESLATAPNVSLLAEQALADPSPHVQQKAQEILGRIGTSRPREGQPAAAERR